MTYITDRRRVEIAAIPLLFLKVASRIAVHCVEIGECERAEDHTELGPAMHYLGLAAAEALLDGRDRQSADKLLRRSSRLAKDLMENKARTGVLPAYRHAQRLLTELLESERLVLYAGSSFDHGYELLDAAILSEPANAEDLEQIDKSATKSARRTLRRIEEKGHFHA
jgi:hypothetical protein